MFKFPRAFPSNLLFSLNQMLSSAEPENENKLQMVSTGYFGKQISLKKIRMNYDWDKMHVSMFVIYPEFSKTSLIEKSSYGLLNYTAEVLNFSLGSLVVKRMSGVREYHAVVLFCVQISCTLSRCSHLLQVGDVWMAGVHQTASASPPWPLVPWALSCARGNVRACWSILSWYIQGWS